MEKDHQGTKIGRVVALAMNVLFRIAGLCLLGLMALVFISVVFRYFLNQPIFAVEDFMSVLLGLTIFMAIPIITLERGHIKVDLLVGLFKGSRPLDRARLILIDLGSLAMLAFLAVQLYGQAAKHLRRGSATQAADIPLWPFSGAFAALLAIGFLAFAVVVIGNWRAGKYGEESGQ
ncbi:MAG: TRAP transporter small permease [Pseudomonadota bacterium]